MLTRVLPAPTFTGSGPARAPCCVDRAEAFERGDGPHASTDQLHDAPSSDGQKGADTLSRQRLGATLLAEPTCLLFIRI